MSDELTITMSIKFSKDGAEIPNRRETLSIDVTGDSFTHQVLSIGTAEEELTQSADLGTPGWCFVKNFDDTNYVEVGLTGSYTVKVKAGESALFRFDGATMYAKANTAACLVEYIIVED